MNNIATFFWGLVIVVGAAGCSEKASHDATQNETQSANQSAVQNVENASIQTDMHEDGNLELAKPLPQFAEPTLDHSDSVGYLKPGAAITFEHDYDGETDPGVRDFFNLHVKPVPKSGNMALELSTSEGLDLLVDSSLNLEMSGQVIVVPIEIFADEAGQYRLNIVASIGEGSPMPSMRAHSVTISVGSESLISSQKSSAPAEDADGETIVSFEAEETIY